MPRAAEVAVVCIWLVMAGLLVSHGLVEGAPVAVADGSLAGEEWMGIYLDGGKVGYAMTKVERVPDGYFVTERMVSSLSVQGSRQEIRAETSSRLDDALTLERFDFSLESGFARMAISGAVKGSMLVIEVDTAGRRQTREIQLDGPPQLASGVGLMLKMREMKPGDSFSIPFFDPATLSHQQMDVKVEGVEELKLGDGLVPVFRLSQRYAGLESTAWISPDLGSIKGEGPMGFTYIRETKEQATSKPEGGYGAADIIALSSVPVRGGPVNPRETVYLRARLSGAELSSLELSGGRQAFENGVVTVTMDGPTSIQKSEPPPDEYLRPSVFVQSDDPAIRAKAAEIAGGSPNALAAARAISDWVYGALEKKPSAGIPSAVEVLRSRSGDCNEHTVLFTALARAAGIPARMAAGIVMMDGRFYYHAWPEVYAGRWVSLDPTFGQFPADATHIRFVEGDLDAQVRMVKVIGKLEVEILEHE